MNNYNNNILNSSIIQKNDDKSKSNETLEEKYLSLLNENKDYIELIKKLEDENKTLKYKIINNLLNTNMNSAFSYLTKELEKISKEKSELEYKLETKEKENQELNSKNVKLEIESKAKKIENTGLKNFNKNLFNQIEQYKSKNNEEKIKEKEKEKEILDLKIKEIEQKTKEEKSIMENKIKELEKESKDKNDKLEAFKAEFNHEYGISKKIRLIINYLMSTNQTLESKILETNKIKETYDKKIVELEEIISRKNQSMENLNMTLEENSKKLIEQFNKYNELNNEYNKIIDLSKEKNEADDNNNNNDIKKCFSILLCYLNKYREIVPFLNNKVDTLENENKTLKEKINLYNVENNKNNEDLLKLKDKENEELKMCIENNKIEKDKIINEKNVIEGENKIIKNDIIFIGEFLKNKKNNNEENNYNNNNDDEENELIDELLNQLNKAKNIITYLSNQK